MMPAEENSATSGTVEALSANIRNSHPELKDSPSSGYILFEANAGDTYHLGFHACSQPDRFRLYLQGVTVEPCDNPVDLAVMEIVSPVSGRDLGNEKVTIKVKNELSNTISGFDVTVSVDGSTSFTETIDATLAAGEEREESRSRPPRSPFLGIRRRQPPRTPVGALRQRGHTRGHDH